MSLFSLAAPPCLQHPLIWSDLWPYTLCCRVSKRQGGKHEPEVCTPPSPELASPVASTPLPQTSFAHAMRLSRCQRPHSSAQHAQRCSTSARACLSHRLPSKRSAQQPWPTSAAPAQMLRRPEHKPPAQMLTRASTLLVAGMTGMDGALRLVGPAPGTGHVHAQSCATGVAAGTAGMMTGRLARVLCA